MPDFKIKADNKHIEQFDTSTFVVFDPINNNLTSYFL